ncbi:PIN domain-containing protein [Amycolatopsis sp. NPDC004747]
MKHKMSIFLDTCVLPRRGRLRTPIISALIQVAARKGMTIKLPQVALEESVNARGREAEEAFDKLLSAFNEGSKFYSLPPIYVPGTAEVEEDWRSELTEAFEVVPLAPDDAVEALIREANRVKPASGGTGSRDSAIWLTVLRGHRASTNETHFVSSNTADFAAKDKKSLNEELRAELQGDTNFHYHKSLDDLISFLAERIGLQQIDNSAVEAGIVEILDSATAAVADLVEDKSTDIALQLGPSTVSEHRVIRAYKIDETILALLEVKLHLHIGDIGEEADELSADEVTARVWFVQEEGSGTYIEAELENVSVPD